jgi:predicted acyl esterase
MTKTNKNVLGLGLTLTLLCCSAVALGQQTTAQTYEVRIDFNRRVPMRDRVELSADVYRPKADGRFPVLLNRTPYTKTSAGNFKIAQYFVAHGYVVVFR